jgi:hypothetical protein
MFISYIPHVGDFEAFTRAELNMDAGWVWPSESGTEQYVAAIPLEWFCHLLHVAVYQASQHYQLLCSTRS